MPEIKVGKNIIGIDQEPFIIAEAGINHNGELETALQMVQVACEAGANAIKFQTFKAEEFVGDLTLNYTYRSQGKEVTESMLDMFKRFEFSRDEWFTIKNYCDKQGIMFLSTPQNQTDLDLLLEIGISAIKVGSDDFNNLPLLKDYAKTGLPLFLSCGMADLGEVYQALDTVGALDGYPAVLLLCTSQYPTPPEDVNLLKLKTLLAAFPMLVMGFSDHTQGPLASSLALALGARVFEKHFTLDHDLPGPDHWFSEDVAGLQDWIKSIRIAQRMMGSAVVRPSPAEKEMRNLARRSMVASCDINEGELLTTNMLSYKRPGTGIGPNMVNIIIGLRAARKIGQGCILRWGDFS